MKNKGVSFIKEFKEFISRGNVIDLAIAVVLGSSFTAIVTSVVNDVIMPIVGIILGGVNFTDLKIIITEATLTTPESAIYYGKLIQNLVNFIIVAFVVFLVIKFINKLKPKKEEEVVDVVEPTPSEDILLLTEIRDLLKTKKDTTN